MFGRVRMPEKRVGRPTKRPSKAELAKMYGKHTIKELAAIYGVSMRTVVNWVSFYREGGNA